MSTAVWPEPLTPEPSFSDDPRFVSVIVRDGERRPVATVPLVVSPRGRTATCGELRILDDTGGARQKARALVLLCREAFAVAAELEQLRIFCPVPYRLVDFVQRLTGSSGQPYTDGWRLYAGDLADFRSRILERTDANGDL